MTFRYTIHVSKTSPAVCGFTELRMANSFVLQFHHLGLFLFDTETGEWL